MVTLRRRAPSQAFTLIEILMVIAVIGILVGISVSVFGGVQNAKARAQAQAQVALIAQSIDLFKTRHGDFPWAAENPGTEEANGEQLFLALLGYKEFQGSNSFVDKTNIPDSGPISFIDPTKIPTNVDLPDTVNLTTAPSGYYFVDPWGNPYVYRYRGPSDTTWDNFSYVLYSMGPDGVDLAIGNDGILTDAIVNDTNNADNIYYGR